jgi:membrane carboxypeptidase/penicillin-binding protein PbpC
MTESGQCPTPNAQLPSSAERQRREQPQHPAGDRGADAPRGSWRWRLLAVAVLAFLVSAVWLRCGPLPAGLLDAALLESTVVVDRHGVPLYEALSGDGTRSTRVTADAIPPAVAAATVAAEDHRFWSHYGVDPVAMLRAARRNLLEGQVVEGGSTITQQAAKLMLLGAGADRRRGWSAKIHEAVVALRLEHRLTKAEILAAYLNLASYGNQITGIERASRAYFGTGSEMLTIAQAAFLAGLPQRPSAFNPYRSEDLAVSRQRVVLRRMIAAGAITAAEAEEARGERLNLSRDGRPFLAPHFVEMVLAGTRPSDRPARLVTTLDAALQREVAGIIRSQRRTLERHGAANVAVVVLDNLRGEWLAWEGSGDYFDRERGGTINGPVSPRQPGSALKPFTYALAFEEGLTPATVLPDVPMTFPTAEPGVVYSPRNYDGKYRVRCSRARHSPGPRTYRRFLSPRRSACRGSCGSCTAPASRRCRRPPRTMASASRSGTRRCGSTSSWPPMPHSRAAANGGRQPGCRPRRRPQRGAGSSPSGRPSGSRTSSPTRTLAPTSSAAAAASTSRSRSR